MQDAAVERHHAAAEAAVVLVASHDPLLGSLEHADDAALGALGRDPLDADHHTVTVEGLLEVHRGDVDVLLPRPGPLRADEAETGGVARETAHHEVHAFGQADARAADLHDGAVVQHAAQHRLQLGPVRLLETQAADELPHGDGLAISLELLEDAFAKIHSGLTT